MASWNILHKDWKAIWKNIRKGRWQRIWEGILRYFYRIIPHDGVKVVDEEWDYLIILDACRYDIFKEVNEIEGELKKKTSRGSTTIEFLNRNFTDYYDDIVYISGNGFVNPFDIHEENYQRENFDSSKHFYKVVPTYLEEENYEYDNVGLKPEAVIDKALEAEERFPEKRKIIHFMQPHTPFIGEYQLTKENNGYLELIDKGFSREEIRKAYKSNLKLVLDSVKKLIDKLEGKIVITADHGDLFGKYGLVDHPHGIYLKELVEIPWLEMNNKNSNRELGGIKV